MLEIEFDKKEDIDLSEFLYTIPKNKNNDCRKYSLKSDQYFYDYFLVQPNTKRDLCLSIGFSSFYAYKQDPEFKYETYRNYLNKYYSIFKSVLVLFSPTKLKKSLNLVLKPIEYIQANWMHELKDYDFKNISKIWNSFK